MKVDPSVKVLKRLKYEIVLLRGWFEKTFPEFSIKVAMSTDDLTHAVTISVDVYNGTEKMSNRNLFVEKFTLSEYQILNYHFMSSFIHEFGNKYRQQIENLIKVEMMNG